MHVCFVGRHRSDFKKVVPYLSSDSESELVVFRVDRLQPVYPGTCKKKDNGMNSLMQLGNTVRCLVLYCISNGDDVSFVVYTVQE